MQAALKDPNRELYRPWQTDPHPWPGDTSLQSYLHTKPQYMYSRCLSLAWDAGQRSRCRQP